MQYAIAWPPKGAAKRRWVRAKDLGQQVTMAGGNRKDRFLFGEKEIAHAVADVMNADLEPIYVVVRVP